MTDRPFKVGDRVAFAARFLRDIGDYSAASADRRGTILEISDELAVVQWPDRSQRTNVRNLIHADRVHLEA